MHWQDIVLSIGQYIFVLALLPSVFGKDKPAFSSSLLTGIILAVFSGVYATLGLWNSTVASSAVAFVWLLLAWQKYRQKSLKDEPEERP